MNKMRVWWMPQVPMKSFTVDIDTLEEGVLLLNTLANYDIFQLENNIKPDFSNMGGIELLDNESGEWEEWEIDSDFGYFGDPKEYIEAKRKVLTDLTLDPTNMSSEAREELEEFISEEISNKTGFCHHSFSFSIEVVAHLDKTMDVFCDEDE